MEKTQVLYDRWNIKKQSIEFGQSHPDKKVFAKPRDVWLIYQGINVGSEQSGQANFLRPVVIIKKVSSLYFCVPLSTKVKENPFVMYLKPNKNLKESSIALLGHAKIIDPKRFIYKIGTIQIDEFAKIKTLLSKFYLS